jgi:hypothetical protein
MSDANLRDMIGAADMILIGLGEEFDDLKCLESEDGYAALRKKIMSSDRQWLMPKADAIYRGRTKSRVVPVLNKLIDTIKDKNYFVISTSTNPDIERLSWKSGRFAAPCGSCTKKQCEDACPEGLSDISKDDDRRLEEYLSEFMNNTKTLDLGVCPKCGKKLVLNNVYTPKYDENGYLKAWNEYRKWLQMTLNRKLLILELGVGMDFPTVVRFPFEKMAYYNNKAVFYRVHERLYQMTAELAGKGVSIAENSIAWLDAMC